MFIRLVNLVALIVCLYNFNKIQAQKNVAAEEESLKLESTEIIQSRSGDDHEYELISNLKIDLNNDRKTDEIIFERSLPWYDDPGDFHKVTVTCKGAEPLILKNVSGWISYSSHSAKFLRKQIDTTNFDFTESEYFITKEIGKHKKLILFLNYPYASHPNLYTIVLFEKNKDPKVVFNSYLNLEKIEDLNTDNKTELIGNVYHRIYEVYTLNDYFTKDDQMSLDYNLTIRKHRKYPLTSLKLMSSDDIDSLNMDELNLMKYEIYADNGIRIPDEKWNNYFKSVTWYIPKADEGELNLFLSELEKKNLKLINNKIFEMEMAK